MIFFLSVLFLFFVSFCGFLALGLKVLRLLGYKAEGAVVLPASLALGMSLAGYIVLGFGQAGWLTPKILGVLYLGLGFFGIFNLSKIVQYFRHNDWPGIGGRSLLVLILCGLFLVLGAFRPETYFDALVYHLGLPQIFLNEHNTEAIPYHFFSAMPLLDKMTATLALAIGGEPLAKLTYALFGLIAPLTLLAWGAEIKKPKAGLVTALLFLTTPIIFRNILRNLTEPTLAGFFILALFFAFQKKEALLAGIFTGLMFSVKNFAGVWCVLIFIFFTALKFKEKNYRDIFKFASAAFCVILPWLLRTWAATDDPLYPYLTTWLHGHPNPEGWNHFLWEAQHFNTSWPPFIREIAVLLRGSFTDFTGAYFIGPSYLIFFLPLTIFALKKNTSPRTLALFTLAGWIAGLSLTHYLRYLSPLLAPVAFLGACGFEELKSLKVKRFFKIAFLVFLVYHLFWMANSFRRSLDQKAIFGLIERDDYLASKLDYWRALKWINANTLTGDRVLLAGETRAYGFKRRLIVSTVHDQHPLAKWIPSCRDSEDLLQIFKSQKVTHVFFNKTESERLAGYAMMALNLKEQNLWQDFLKSKTQVVYKDAHVEIFKI